VNKTGWSILAIIMALIVIDGRFGQYVTDTFGQEIGQLVRIAFIAIMLTFCWLLKRSHDKYRDKQPKPFPKN